MSNLELKYVKTPAGNVASHETVVHLAKILKELGEANSKEHEEIRMQIERMQVILDQLVQLSETASQILENQQEMKKDITKILKTLSTNARKQDNFFDQNPKEK